MNKLALGPALSAKPPAVLSFYGGGGKTALISRLASEITSSSEKALITTTTKIYPPAGMPLFIDDRDTPPEVRLMEHFAGDNLAVTGKRILADNKIEGISPRQVRQLRERLPVTILVEADGSRGLPLKGYGPAEPVIPSCSDLVAAVAGADALERPLDGSAVHRPEEFARATGLEPGKPITEKTLAAAFNYMLKIGRAQAGGAGQLCILNKTDLLKYPGSTALEIGRILCREIIRPATLLLTSDDDAGPVKITLPLEKDGPHAAVACVVLAAGTSSRMGRDKLSLPLGRQTILEHTLERISAAGPGEIIVVTIPGSPWTARLDPEKYRLVENPAYRTGMASSLKAGLSAVSSKTQGTLFALGDQPLIPAEVYRQLIYSYRSNLNLVTCPLYLGRRGNPALFDRRTWPQLMGLSGDRGGRVLFDSIDENEMILLETGLALAVEDVDTPENYRLLLDSFSAGN